MFSFVGSLKKLPVTNKLIAMSLSRCLSNIGSEDYYDIVLCGGGLVGGAMACAFARSKFFTKKKILMLDQAPEMKMFDIPPETYSYRVIAVSPSSKKLLSSLDIWDNISRKCDVNKMQVWETCSDSMITFGENNLNEKLCYIIENNLITNEMYKLLSSSNNQNVDLLFKTKVNYCSFPNEHSRSPNDSLALASIELDNGRRINTELVIGADGAKSFVADEAKFKKVCAGYDQAAIVATLQFSDSCENYTAWQRFLTTGPIALLPLNDSQSSLVWSTSSDDADRLVNLDDSEFCWEVNNAFNHEGKNNEISSMLNSLDNLGFHKTNFQLPPNIKCVSGPKAKFPLGVAHSNCYVKPRVALIGDAAHRVHPLAGQGANLGFGDVSCLIKILENAVYEGRDLGTLLHLLQYESTRQAHNVPVMGTIHALNALYSTEFAPLVAFRSLGLSLVNSNQTLKNFLMQGAMS